MHDALRCRGSHWAACSARRIAAQRVFRSLRPLRWCNMCAYLLLLGFFERPAWCYTQNDCGDPHVVLRMNLPVLPVAASLAIEGVCISLFMAEIALKVAAHALAPHP